MAVTGTMEPTEKTEAASAGHADGLLTDSLVVPKEQLMGKVYPTDGSVNTPHDPPDIVILVTGDRYARYTEWADLIAAQIWNQCQGRPYELVHGAQKRWDREHREYTGIDYVAAQVAYQTIGNWGMSCLITAFPADWGTFGKSAGPRRNAEMRDYLLHRQEQGARIICLAFHPNLEASRGTGHMVKIAQAAGIHVETFDGKRAAS